MLNIVSANRFNGWFFKNATARAISFAFGAIVVQQAATRRFHHPDSLTGPRIGGR